MKKLIFIGLIFLISCKKESQNDHIGSFPSEVQEIVQTFLNEGENRGVSLDIRKIHKIILGGPTGVKGYDGIQSAAYYDHHKKSIYIDTTHHDYKMMREVTIFHELGHGLLHREHRSDLLPNHEPASIMHQSWLPDYRWTFSFKRDYYLDELFFQLTASADWSK